jgi:site-specific DNA recombinase
MENRVAIYTRVSTEEQAKEGFSLEAQKDYLINYCKMNSLEVTAIYSDEGLSGKDKNRPQLQKLLRESATNKFDMVLVWKQSRISRSLFDLLSIVQELERNNVKFRGLDSNFDTTTPFGRFGLHMMGAASELERGQIVENVHLGMNQRAKEGKYNGGVVFGYKNVAKELVVDEEEAKIIEQIFAWYLDGIGPVMIRDRLNNMGIKTKKGNEFTTFAVRFILQNAIYKGEIEFGRKSKKQGKDGVIVSKGTHKAIVTEEVFNAVQIKFAKNKPKTKRGSSGVHLLASILRCPVCGSKMYYHPGSTRKADGTYRGYYICSKPGYTGKCSFKTINSQKIEQAVTEKIVHVIQNQDIIKGVVQEINTGGTVDLGLLKKQVKIVEKEINEFEQGRKNILIELGKGKIDPDTFNEVKKVTEEQLKECYTKKSLLEKELIKSINTTVKYEDLFKVFSNFKVIFVKADMKMKKRLLNSLIDKILLNHDKTIKHIEFKFEVPNNNSPNDDDDQKGLKVVRKQNTPNRITSEANFFG